MHPVEFPGSVEIKKPDNMTDEECLSAWAKFGLDTLYRIIQANAKIPNVAAGIDELKFPFYITAWVPNKEDLDALNKGLPIYVKTLSRSLPPMALFTLNENNEPNYE